MYKNFTWSLDTILQRVSEIDIISFHVTMALINIFDMSWNYLRLYRYDSITRCVQIEVARVSITPTTQPWDSANRIQGNLHFTKITPLSGRVYCCNLTTLGCKILIVSIYEHLSFFNHNFKQIVEDYGNFRVYNPFKRLVCNLIFLISKIAWIDV